MASLLKTKARIIAWDIRGHGYTEVENESEMSVENLVADLQCLLGELLSEPAPIILIGHSMGGAFAIHAAHEIENIVTVKGHFILMGQKKNRRSNQSFYPFLTKKSRSWFCSFDKFDVEFFSII